MKHIKICDFLPSDRSNPLGVPFVSGLNAISGEFIAPCSDDDIGENSDNDETDVTDEHELKQKSGKRNKKQH